MDRIENIKIMNDLVLRTERGELSWSKTNYAGVYSLSNSNGVIEIGKTSSGDIHFKIVGVKGDVVTDDIYLMKKDEDLQVYKVSNVLWLLIKDLSVDSKVDFQEILNLLEEEE
ncbi:hypothetical protein EW093_16935 [Thiospirochaeta perfilievii]|uniref:Uncharacterized protein n=1 Tax=Thiospirochaeta perfilievii TaxID=252967 RepID=A0A5C1QE13_9SPIO|nr:hypothetical protein [Thiospirochaeta perfilievii]QEN06303.1 hypothetical protein EW093_16935 [Thiospirochaeta perfilievii]